MYQPVPMVDPPYHNLDLTIHYKKAAASSLVLILFLIGKVITRFAFLTHSLSPDSELADLTRSENYY